MRTIRFGLVGTGRITDWVLRGAVLDPRFKAEAVCSRTEAAARRFAEGHGIPRIFTDVDAMAADPDIDAVYIGTPNHTHHDLAIRCMRRGKHVLCEKPLASNAREAAEMARTAREMLSKAVSAFGGNTSKDTVNRPCSRIRVIFIRAPFCACGPCAYPHTPQ